MHCAHGAAFAEAIAQMSAGDNEPLAESPLRPPETELEFLMRRGMEESQLAKHAATPQAAAAHSYLASAYSAAICEELKKQAELDSLLLQIS